MNSASADICTGSGERESNVLGVMVRDRKRHFCRNVTRLRDTKARVAGDAVEAF